MSRNLTVSYFSDAKYLSPYRLEAAVATTMLVNVYHYNIGNFVLAYPIAFGASVLVVAIGLYVYAANGYVNGTANFSAILCTTNHTPDLSNLIERSTTATNAKSNFSFDDSWAGSAQVEIEVCSASG